MAGVEGAGMTYGRAAAFFDEVHRRLVADDGTFVRLGSPVEMERHLSSLYDTTTRRVWSMSERSSLHSLRRGHAQTLRSSALGVDCRALVSPGALRVRLISSFLRPGGASCRVVPVPGSMLLADDVLLSGGRRGSHLEATIWRTEDEDLVRAAADAFVDTWDRARPLDEVALLPALDERALSVALSMIDGDTDQEIAGRLGVGTRTVQSLVRHIVDWCGARNRTHAVALLAGSDE